MTDKKSEATAAPAAKNEAKAVELPLTKGKPSPSDIAMAKAILEAAGENPAAPVLKTADEIAATDGHEQLTFRTNKLCYTPDGRTIEPGQTFSCHSSGYANAITGRFEKPPYLDVVTINEDTGKVTVVK